MSSSAAGRDAGTIVTGTRAGHAEAVLTAFLLNVFLNSGGAEILMGGASSRPGDLTSSEGNTFIQVIFVVFFSVSIFLARPEPGKRWRFDLPLSMALALGWCWLSLSWALDPAIALRRVAFLTLVPVTIFTLVATAGWERAFRAYGRSVAVSVLLYVLAVLMLPAAVQTDIESIGAWRGLSIDKNTAGAFAANAAIVLAFIFFRKDKKPEYILVYVLAFIMAMILLFQSRSKTSIAVLFVAAILGFVTLICLKNSLIRYISVILSFGIFLFLILFYDDIASRLTDLTNDPGALTGRTQIWPPLLGYLSDHAWLGSGYGSFWSIGDQSPILPYARGYLIWLRTVPNAHNGYLEIAIQIGLCGLALVLFATIIEPLIRVWRNNVSSAMYWLVSTSIFFIALQNILEATIFNRASIPWVMFLIIIALSRNFRSDLLR